MGQGDFVSVLKPDGSAWSWGRNIYGYLGDNTTDDRSSPVPVVGNHSFKYVGNGGQCNIALKADGSCWTWGYGGSGGIGNNTLESYSSPVMVVGNHSFRYAVFNRWAAIALKEDGSAWCWGDGRYGNLGNQTRSTASSPVAVVGNHSFIKVGTSGELCFGIKSNGEMWTWGNGGSGRLGVGAALTSTSSPVLVIGNHSFVGGDAGYYATHGFKADGSVWSWGENQEGSVGDNTTVDRNSPVPVVGNHSFTQISANWGGITALKANGEVWCWGLGVEGQLGDGDILDRSSPVKVIGNHSFTAVASSVANGYGFKYDGSMWGWGANDLGTLGNNEYGTSHSSPVLVVGNHVFVQGLTSTLILQDITLEQQLVWTGWTWGAADATPHTPAPWSEWLVKESAADARDTGDWGRLQLLAGDEFVSSVKDLGDFGGAERLLKVTTDDYDTGSGSGTIQWRGSETAFNQSDDEVSGPAWENYPAPLGANKTWRYVQIKVSVSA